MLRWRHSFDLKIGATVKRKSKRALLLIIKLPFLLVELPFNILIVLIIRMLRPYFLIRLKPMVNWRIGHFGATTEMYLCQRDAGVNKPDTPYIDIWIYPTKPCNKQLSNMWKRILYIDSWNFLGRVDQINSLIPGGELHQFGDKLEGTRDVLNLLDSYPQHLNFLPEEDIRGKEGLRDLGIPVNAPFVCLLVRDSAYLNDQSPHLDWSRHDFRDCNVQNYVFAAQKLTELGYYVVRMGSLVKEPINIEHPMIIDYATNGMRNDFMDIYLGAKCTFFISNGSGVDTIPYIFRQPILYVDIVSLGYMSTFSPKFISTTKKHWLRNENRYMSFREIFESGAAYFMDSSEFESMGIDLIESSPEEIAAVVLEMESRLRGSWVTDKDDEGLQRQFWNSFPQSNLHGEFRSRIGTDFLRRYNVWTTFNE